MRKGIIGRKLGMTQVFDEHGVVIPVTVIEAGPCVVIQKKTPETDGYAAIQVGFQPVGERALSRPLKGHFAAAKVTPMRFLRELRLDSVDGFEPGQEIRADVFSAGEYVDVTGTTKGHGFSGGVKRWGFHRGPMAHGSKYHRGPGSLQSRKAARVFKGRLMPGRYGGERVTIQNLKVVRVDAERNLILIRGAVPGADGSLVTIKDAVKAR
ncbi:MAG: 50S ribosomal protein L3 [Firmicutes bacterium]|nr:50S ribosomal protein L3 [Bacillota bacterium]